MRVVRIHVRGAGATSTVATRTATMRLRATRRSTPRSRAARAPTCPRPKLMPKLGSSTHGSSTGRAGRRRMRGSRLRGGTWQPAEQSQRLLSLHLLRRERVVVRVAVGGRRGGLACRSSAPPGLAPAETAGRSPRARSDRSPAAGSVGVASGVCVLCNWFCGDLPSRPCCLLCGMLPAAVNRSCWFAKNSCERPTSLLSAGSGSALGDHNCCHRLGHGASGALRAGHNRHLTAAAVVRTCASRLVDRIRHRACHRHPLGKANPLG